MQGCAAATAVRRIVARVPGPSEPQTTRLRLARLLQVAELAPPGLPPQAILVIRQASAPTPLRLSGARADGAWERRARDDITALYRAAARPERGHVPPAAEVVLFLDWGELLACFALAGGRRPDPLSWLWRAVDVAPGDGSGRIAASLALRPRLVPAAVSYLARWQSVGPVVRSWSPAEVDGVIQALHAEFGLPLRRAPTERQSRTHAPAAVNGAPGASTTRLAPHDLPDGKRSLAPRVAIERPLPAGRGGQTEAPRPELPRWISPLLRDPVLMRLSVSIRRLAALALALTQGGAVARSGEFTTAVEAWLDHAPRTGTAVRPAARAPTSTPARTVRRKADQAISRSARPCPQLPPNGGLETRAAAPLPANPREAGVGERPRLPGASPQDPRSEPGAGTQPGEAADPHSPPWLEAESCQTRLGGVLFLLNLFARTDLPDCFEEAYGLAGAISGWGLAEMFGRILIAALARPDLEADPLFDLLIRLDGRTPDEPLPPLRDTDAYRLPPAWLGDDLRPLLATRSRGHLVIWHPDRFLVLDRVIGASDERATAREELGRYRRNGRLPDVRWRAFPDRRLSSALAEWRASPVLAALPATWRGWATGAFSYLDRRLMQALAVRSDRALARALLLRRGRVYATATHVDLVLRLDDISLSVRRAGLDANPGWVRDLMRVVTFHFD